MPHPSPSCFKAGKVLKLFKKVQLDTMYNVRRWTPSPQCGKIQYTVEKNGVKKPWWNINSYDIRMLNHQKNKKFPDQILQKSTRGNWPSSKTHRIKKPTPLWKTNFLRCTTLPFNQKLFVNPEGGNKHFVFSQLR